MALLDFTNAPHGGRQRHLPEWQSQPRITPTTIIDHSIVGSAEGAWQMFKDRSVLESHFIVDLDGEIWQLMDTGRQADANLNANGFAISIETADRGDPDKQPWTAEQLDSLEWLHEALLAAHPTIPRRKCPTAAGGGLGYHTLFGAPSPWTPVAKSCPGQVRKAQWSVTLLPAFLNPEEEDMGLTAGDKDWIETRLEETERRTARYVDHGEADTAGSNHHHQTIRGDLSRLTAQVTQLTTLVEGLVLGKIEGDLTATMVGTLHLENPPE